MAEVVAERVGFPVAPRPRAALAARSPARSWATRAVIWSSEQRRRGAHRALGPPRGGAPALGAQVEHAADVVLGDGGEPGGAQGLEHLDQRLGADQHGRRDAPQLEALGLGVDHHLGDQRLVLGAQERRRRPAAQASVAAGDVVDEVGQPLGHRRGRAGAEQLVQVRGRLPQVERAAHRALADPVDGRAARGLDVGDAVERRRELGFEASRRDGGEVGLQEHVVDGLGQGAAQRGGRGAVGVVAGATRDDEQLARGGGDRVVGDEPERRRLAQHRARHLVALPPALARARARPGTRRGRRRSGGRRRRRTRRAGRAPGGAARAPRAGAPRRRAGR